MLVCAYLAAVFLCLDARREGHDDLADQFRIRALGTAATTGAVGLVGIFVLRADAPLLFEGLIGRALPVIVVSVLAGVASIVLLDRAPLRHRPDHLVAGRRDDPHRLGRGPVPVPAAART